MPDGRLILFYHVGQDICEEYGKDSGWLISDDGGDSWRAVTPEEMPAVKGFSGTRLPSGKYIRIITPPNRPVDKDFYKDYPNRGRIRNGWAIPAEDIPQDLFPLGWQYGIYDPEAFGCEGFCEPFLSFLPDGSMVTLIRTDSHSPSYIAHSYDGGNTWTKPEKFDRIGVFPQLLTLDCGVTLASYGRPGVRLRATADPHGKEWDTPIELIPYTTPEYFPDGPNWVWRSNTCSYTVLIPLDERTAMLAYSDFRVKDEEGVERKCLMVRKIHVE